MNVGDLILGVSQNPDEEPVDISIMKLSDAVDLIKGEKGTKVYLMVKRVGSKHFHTCHGPRALACVTNACDQLFWPLNI